MNDPYNIPWHRDKVLFTPGPLTTSLSVKQAMLHDAGSWHYEFHTITKSIQDDLLKIADLDREQDGYEVVLLQGSGTYGVEAIFASAIPRDGKLLILTNGAYGERMIAMCEAMALPYVVFRTPEDTPPTGIEVEALLENDPGISHVACVHCETTTGILNPIEEIGRAVRKFDRQYIVDAMSSFGALPIDFKLGCIDYLVSSPNKCFESVPGFTYVFVKRALLEAVRGQQRSLSLDLLHQMEYFEKKGQFRYTPPTHTLLAFHQALIEFHAEGGIQARGARYKENHSTLIKGMRALGFKPFLDPSLQSYIITSFHFPENPNFNFEDFYRILSHNGLLIYPGKLTDTECFRIANIGRIFKHDILNLLDNIKMALNEMKVTLS